MRMMMGEKVTQVMKRKEKKMTRMMMKESQVRKVREAMQIMIVALS